MNWKNNYPYLYDLYTASDRCHPDNYFARMDDFQSPLAIQGYCIWEARFARLDSQSRCNIIKRAAPLVTRRDNDKGRHWTALFETLNEIKGYNYLQDLGYITIYFIPTTNSHRTPDLHGKASFGNALLEVKTVNISDNDILRFGELQKGQDGLPDGLKNKLKFDYTSACKQLNSYSIPEPARRICYFDITIDFEVVLGVPKNKQALCSFFVSIKKNCEIIHHSQYW